MNRERAAELVRSQERVRVFLNYGTEPAAEGRVIAYSDAPTITVEDDDGNRTHWQINLPIEVQHCEWRKP